MFLKRMPGSKKQTTHLGILPTKSLFLPLKYTKEHRWIHVHFQNTNVNVQVGMKTK